MRHITHFSSRASVTGAKSNLETALTALQNAHYRAGRRPAPAGSVEPIQGVDIGSYLREVTYRKAEYLMSIKAFIREFPNEPQPPIADNALLSKANVLDGLLEGDEPPLGEGYQFDKQVQPGTLLKKEDIRDEHGNYRTPTNVEGARLLSQVAFKDFYSHVIDDLIKRGGELEPERLEGFIQSVKHLFIVSNRDPERNNVEAKAIRKAIVTEFLTLYQQSADKLLMDQLGQKFFPPALGAPPATPETKLVRAAVPLPPALPVALTTQTDMLRALGRPNDPADNNLPSLPTLAEFKAAILALQPNSRDWNSFWATVPAVDREQLKVLVTTSQGVIADNSRGLATEGDWNRKFSGTDGQAFRNQKAALDYVEAHDSAVKDISLDAMMTMAPVVMALGLAEEGAKRGPINSDALGTTAYASRMAAAKHGTPETIKQGRAHEIKVSVEAAAQIVKAKYGADAKPQAAPAAAAAAVSNEIFAKGSVLRNISAQGAPNPQDVQRALDAFGQAACDGINNAQRVPENNLLLVAVRGTVITAISQAARAQKDRLNSSTPRDVNAALARIAGAGAVAAAVASAYMKNVDPLVALDCDRGSDLGIQAASWFMTHGAITEADIRRLPAAALQPRIPENIIKAFSRAAQVAVATNQCSEAANTSREQAKGNFVRAATASLVAQGVGGAGIAAYIGDKIALHHFTNGSIDDASVRAIISEARREISRVCQTICYISLPAQNFGLQPGALPDLLNDFIRLELIHYFNNAGNPGKVRLADIRQILGNAETKYNAPPRDHQIQIPNDIKDRMSQNILNAVTNPNTVLHEAGPDNSRAAETAFPNLLDLAEPILEELSRSAQTSFSQVASQAIGAGVGSIGVNQLGQEITAEFKNNRSTLELTTIASQKLPTDEDSIQSLAIAAFITQSDRRAGQPPVQEVFDKAFEISRPPGMMIAATAMAAAAKNTALEIGRTPTEANDIAQEIVKRYVDLAYPVTRHNLAVSIQNPLPVLPPMLPPGQLPENLAKIRENVLVAYAVSRGQQAGDVAVKAHPAAAAASKVTIRAIASVSAALANYNGASAPLADKIAAALAKLYAELPPGEKLTDAAIAACIRAVPGFIDEFPQDPARDSFLNNISKATRAVSTLTSLNPTAATTAAAKAFPTDDEPDHRNSYQASIIAALCAGNKPVDIANSAAVAKAGVLATTTSAKKVGSPAAAAASAMSSLQGDNLETLFLAKAAAAPVLDEGGVRAFILTHGGVPGALTQIALSVTRAIDYVDNPGGPLPNVPQPLQLAVVTRVGVNSTAAGGATPISVSQAVSTAVSIATAAVKAGCSAQEAEEIAVAACEPSIMAQGLGAISNKVKSEINACHKDLSEASVNDILKAASSGFGIGIGVIAGDISRLAANAVVAGTQVISVLALADIPGLAIRLPANANAQNIVQAISDSVRDQLGFMPGGMGIVIIAAWAQNIIDAATAAANDALTAYAGHPGATAVSVSEAVAVAVATAIAAVKAGLTGIEAGAIAIAARDAGRTPAAIAQAIKDKINDLLNPIQASPEQIAVITQSAITGLKVRRDVARGVDRRDAIKDQVVSGSIKTTASTLMNKAKAGEATPEEIKAEQDKIEEIGQAAEDSLNNNETGLEMTARVSSLLSGGTGLAVAAVGAFVVDRPAITLAEHRDTAQKVSQAAGISQVPATQRVLSTRPRVGLENIAERGVLESHTQEQRAQLAKNTRKEFSKAMEKAPDVTSTTVNLDKCLIISFLDAKKARGWKISGPNGEEIELGDKNSPYRAAAMLLEKCVDGNGKSYLTAAVLKDTIKELEAQSFLGFGGVASGIRVVEGRGGELKIHFGSNGPMQINRLLTTFAKNAKTNYDAHHEPSPGRGLTS